MSGVAQDYTPAAPAAGFSLPITGLQFAAPAAMVIAAKLFLNCTATS